MPLVGTKAVVPLEGQNGQVRRRLGAQFAMLVGPNATVTDGDAKLAGSRLLPVSDLPARCESLPLVHCVHSADSGLAGALTGHPFVQAGDSVVVEVRLFGSKPSTTRRLQVSSFREFCGLVQADQQNLAAAGRRKAGVSVLHSPHHRIAGRFRRCP